MSSKKQIITIVITTAALSISSVGFASVAGAKAQRVAFTKSMAHAAKDANHAAHKAAWDANHAAHKAAKDANHAAHEAAKDANHAAHEALISSTIGLDAAAIKTRLKAGESLGAIAGDNKDALIEALVAFSTTKIDAAVTAGKITAAQATTVKASLVAHVTQAVNSTRTAHGFQDHKGKQMGNNGGPKGHKGWGR